MSDRPQVYIPSRGRWEGARKLTQAWHKEGFDVNWVVEQFEWATYTNRVENAKIFPLPLLNMGIGYSRNHCINLAVGFDHESIILADDDIKPAAKGGNMLGLVEAAKHPKVLGITARYSYHDLCLGYGVKSMDSLILLPTGTFRMVALNVQNVIRLGNYDVDLEYAEDCDLFLRGLARGYPWLLHAGTWTNSIGKRYEPGGMLDFTDATIQGGIAPYNDKLSLKKAIWHKEIHYKWPALTNEHTARCAGKQNCIRIGWRKAYNTFLPNWQEWSDLHGGSLEGYLEPTKHEVAW